MTKPTIFLAVPTYNRQVDSATPLLVATSICDAYVLRYVSRNNSLLPHNFNLHWCDALNNKKNGVTHFAMLHPDVTPLNMNWLQIIFQELIKYDADVMGVCIPVKSDSTMVSTAFCKNDFHKTKNMNDLKCLTYAQLAQLPETFDSRVKPGHKLLINTGLWIADIRSSWIESCFFEIQTWKDKNEQGEHVAHCLSEDWAFSLQLHARGAKVFVTQKIGIKHWGIKDYEFQANYSPNTNNGELERPPAIYSKDF